MLDTANPDTERAVTRLQGRVATYVVGGALRIRR